MNMDILESENRRFSQDPIQKFEVKGNSNMNTIKQSVYLRSNHSKSMKLTKIIVIVLIASILLMYFLNKSKSNENSEEEKISNDSNKQKNDMEEEGENEIIDINIPEMRIERSYHLNWLNIETLKNQRNLDDFLTEKIQKEIKDSDYYDIFHTIKGKYNKILKMNEFSQLSFAHPVELTKKIDDFLNYKKNLTQVYGKSFNLTDEILQELREYTLCRTKISLEKDKITNVSLENERKKIQMRILQGAIQEIETILASDVSDSHTLLKKYEKEKNSLENDLQNKQRELSYSKNEMSKIRKELEDIGREISGLNHKDIQKSIYQKGDDIEEIKRKMKILLAEKEEKISNIDFLNKRLKSYDNIAKVSENFKEIGSSVAPKILLETLKHKMKEYIDKPYEKKIIVSSIKDMKEEYIEQMHTFINAKKKLQALDNPSLIALNVEKREKYLEEVKIINEKYEELERRLRLCEKELDDLRNSLLNLEKKQDAYKTKELEKEKILGNHDTKIQNIEKEIDLLNDLLDEKEKLINNLKHQPKIDPNSLRKNKKELELQIQVLQQKIGEKTKTLLRKYEFSSINKQNFTKKGIIAEINLKIKECKVQKGKVEKLMKKNQLDDFNGTLNNLLNLKEELRTQMGNFIKDLE